MSRDLTGLTDLHLMILGALWSAGEATIAQVHAAIRHQAEATPKTIATLLARLEQRGIVSHHLVGREGVYRPHVGRREVLMARMGGMLSSYFAAEDSPSLADVSTVPDDTERVRTLLRRAERELLDNSAA